MPSLTYSDVQPHYAPTLMGEVKWFDTIRGFGFVRALNFDKEFLLHQNVLQKSRRETLVEGSKIRFRYEESTNGLRITEIISVKKPLAPTCKMDFDSSIDVSAKRIPARVKWYDRSKGYGFVNCFGCAEDIFIGSATLMRNGFRELTIGQALCIRVAEVKGHKRVHTIHDWCIE